MEILNKADLSKYLRVSLGTVKYLLYENKIPKIKIGKEYRFIKSDIDNWIMKRKELPKSFAFGGSA